MFGCRTRVPSSLCDLHFDNLKSLYIDSNPGMFAHLPYTKGLIKVLKKFGKQLLTLGTAPIHHMNENYNQILDLVPNLETLEMNSHPTYRLLNWHPNLETIRLPQTLTYLKLNGVRMTPCMLRELRSNPRSNGIVIFEFTTEPEDTVAIRKILDKHAHIVRYGFIPKPYKVPPPKNAQTLYVEWRADFN